jgi:hypothetical protein
MEIKPDNGGYAVYKAGHWCTWATTREFAEKWSKHYDQLAIESLPLYQYEVAQHGN